MPLTSLLALLEFIYRFSPYIETVFLSMIGCASVVLLWFLSYLWSKAHRIGGCASFKLKPPLFHLKAVLMREYREQRRRPFSLSALL